MILWLQIIDYAKFYHKNVVFVGDDLKDDWWVKNNGKLDQPRKELLKEFRDKTDAEIVFHTTKGFIKASKQKLKDKTIKEVDRVREENMKMNDYMKLKDYNHVVKPEYLATMDIPYIKSVDVPFYDKIQSLEDYQTILDIHDNLERIRKELNVPNHISEQLGKLHYGFWKPIKKK